MKKAFLSVLSVLSILLLATCAPISDRSDPEAKWEEVQKEAQDKTLSPDQMVWLVIGDRSKIEDSLNELGMGVVRVIDTEGNPVD